MAKTHHINKMRIAGNATAQLLDFISPFVTVGVSTGFLDDLCHKFILDTLKATPANLGYNGFPKTICTSINEVVCHGIPDDNRVLLDGDILNIDVAVKLNGVYGDASRMYMIGNVTEPAKELVYHTQQALDIAISSVKPGIDINKIGEIIQNYAYSFNYGVVTNYCGHGIGKKYHEWPNIPHSKVSWPIAKILPGMIFTIEPMLTMSKESSNHVLEDNWTVITNNLTLSAQWEHTILVTNTGAEILTI